MNNVRLKLSPPWITYVNELKALFDGDPMIAFNDDFHNEAGPTVVIACGNGDKTAALMKLLPTEKVFGNVKLHILVDGVPTNRAFTSMKELFDTVFQGNPAFAYAVEPNLDGYNWIPVAYVVFKNCVVQFFNDNLNDCHGIISTLYETIAEDIFKEFKENNNAIVYFNTDIERGAIGKPLGEWP